MPFITKGGHKVFISNTPGDHTSAVLDAVAQEIKDSSPTGHEFPTNLSHLKTVKALGGSTGATLVEDSLGNKFVLKRGASPEHVKEEFAAEEMYRAAGVAIPASRLYDEGGK